MQTILVCDDDKEIVEAIEIYLQQEGYHVLKAYDGEQALDMLKKNEVHLLIIDVMMPKLDGIRATLKIREESSIPIIILSAKSIDGVYDSDPKINPAAKKYDTISINEVVEKKLGVIDMTASVMCMENKMPLMVFGLEEENSIVNALSGKFNGTVVTVD